MDGEWISDHNAIVAEVLLIPTYDSIEIPAEDTGKQIQLKEIFQ